MLEKTKTIIIAMAVFFVFLIPFFCLASNSTGTVDSSHKYAWGENLGWVNFAPTDGVDYVGITITDTAVSGYAWSQAYGWINFDPTNSGQSVTNNCSGQLGGYAWVGTLGWINMSGVTINSSGQFTGTAGALGTNAGRISFGCTNCDVATDWRPCSYRTIPDQIPGGIVNIPENPPQVPPEIQPPPPSEEPEVPGPVGPVGPPPVAPVIPPSNPVVNPPEEITPPPENPPAVNPPTPVYPIVPLIEKIISTIGLLFGLGAFVSNLLANPISIKEVPMLVSRSWTFLSVILGLKKKKPNPWGTVYDSVTKQPLDPAYVSLQDTLGKEVGDSFTDLDGRYGFLIGPGTYKMIANKTNYAFPSEKLKGKENDELYDHLYFGGPASLTEKEAVLARNIPMDPIRFDWNEFAKRDKKLMKFHSKADMVFSAKVAVLIFIAGFIMAIIALVTSPYPYNIITFILYILVLISNLLGLRPKFTGRITDIITGEPFSFAILRVVLPLQNKEMFSRACDRLGRYYCLVPPGDYYIKIDKKNFDGSYSQIYTSHKLNAKKGIIDQHFRV
ncbi:MAG: carboxypeptidase-like regulatory domain-containing protein [Candidatus Pacebacteria bacterium]|nr:carboxypeptidase-like regulatory domain-containing protein [Candidatus Paceibacterota bacterium]